MKYLKHINEAFVDLTESDIKECFLDIIDNEFKVKAEIYDNWVHIRICSGDGLFDINDGKPFKVSEISETLLFAIPYLQSEYGLHFKYPINNNKFKLDKINARVVNSPGDDFWKSFNTVNDLCEYNKRVRIVNIRMDKSENINEANSRSDYSDDFRQDLKEILLEVEDIGYTTETLYNNKINNYITITNGKLDVEIKDIIDCLLRVRQFLGSKYILFEMYFGNSNGKNHVKGKWNRFVLNEDIILEDYKDIKAVSIDFK